MTRVMLPGQHAWLRAPQAHTHTAAETIPSDMIISGLGTRPGSGTEGWGEKRRHLYWLLAASSLVKVVLKTLKYTDCSCTLLNGAAFYKQPKNLSILPALFFVSLSFPAGGGHPYTSLSPTFQFPQEPQCYPVTANEGQVTPLAHREWLWGTGPCLENLVFRF